MERMIYSYSKIQKCFDKIKSVNFHVNNKAEHFLKWIEISGLFDFCFDNTGCLLFNAEWSSEYRNYTKMINQMKQFSKKEMDKALRVCELFLKNEIASIYNEMESGEVDSEL